MPFTPNHLLPPMPEEQELDALFVKLAVCKNIIYNLKILDNCLKRLNNAIFVIWQMVIVLPLVNVAIFYQVCL